MVSQGGFTMINMCDDAKIPDVLHVRFTSFLRWAKVGVLDGKIGIVWPAFES